MAGQPAAPQLAISVLAAPPRHAKAEKIAGPYPPTPPKSRTSAAPPPPPAKIRASISAHPFCSRGAVLRRRHCTLRRRHCTLRRRHCTLHRRRCTLRRCRRRRTLHYCRCKLRRRHCTLHYCYCRCKLRRRHCTLRAVATAALHSSPLRAAPSPLPQHYCHCRSTAATTLHHPATRYHHRHRSTKQSNRASRWQLSQAVLASVPRRPPKFNAGTKHQAEQEQAGSSSARPSGWVSLTSGFWLLASYGL
jgi:hypothetical protein